MDNGFLICVSIYYLIGYILMLIYLRNRRIKQTYTTFERDTVAFLLLILWPLLILAVIMGIVHESLNKLVDKLVDKLNERNK